MTQTAVSPALTPFDDPPGVGPFLAWAARPGSGRGVPLVQP